MKKLIALLLALVLVFALVSCSGSDNDSNGESANTDGEQNTTSTAGSNTVKSDGKDEVDAASSAHISEINIGMQGDIGSFAPWSAQTNGRSASLWSIYESLAWMNPSTGELEPVLAKSWDVDADNNVIHIELFDYITDWKGNNIKASDVVFSKEADEAVGYWTFGWIDDIVETGEYTFDVKLVDGLEVYAFENWMNGWFIVSQKAYEESGDGMVSEAVGTGPYKYTDYTVNYLVTVEAVDNYWQKDELRCQAQLTNVDKINYYIIAESAQRTMALETGTIDMCAAVSAEDLYIFEDNPDYWIFDVPDNLSIQVYCNMSGWSITSDDINLRKAIFYAINPEGILNSVYGGSGEVLTSLVPSWSAEYPEGFKTTDNYYDYDLDKAKEYLEASNYEGEELIILVSSVQHYSDSATLVLGYLNAIGIKAKLDVVDSTVIQTTTAQAEGWDILVTTRSTNVFAANGYCQPFDSDNWPDGTVNHIHDDKLQELVLAANNVATSNEETLMALHNYVVENAYGMGVVNYDTKMVISSKVETVALTSKKTIYAGCCVYAEQ